MKLLVTGFGPFGEVRENPAARLARGVDGVRMAGLQIVGAEIPVSYSRAVERTVALVEDVQPDVVLGVGVAVQRDRPELERIGRSTCGETPDVDGVCGLTLPGPAELGATLDVPAWADALQCAVSSDAGRYVCNAWLHQVAQRLTVPTGFLHIPPGGVPDDWLVAGLARLLTSRDLR